MVKVFKVIFLALLMMVCSLMSIPCGYAGDMTFHRKLIDANTKDPIEGAVVVAIWYEARGTIAGESTRLKDLKETLTDKDGKWSIQGPKGRPIDSSSDFIVLLTLITGIHYTREPEFLIFKPGYCPWPKGFSIDACKEKMKSSGEGEIMEGKVIELPKLTKREDRSFAIPEPDDGTDPNRKIEFLEKQKEFLKLINEERRNLGL